MKKNPLNAWHQLGPLSRVDQQSRPMTSARAPRAYKKYLERVAIPMAVVVGTGPESERIIRQEQAAGNVVLWMPVSWTTSGVMLEHRHADRPHRLLLEETLRMKRWSFQRISTMTPFTLLHRLGDCARNELAPASLRQAISEARLESGFDALHVDTLAGRHGVFKGSPNGGAEATSDLFAKYLLTGRIAYHPSGPRTKAYLEELRVLFPEWANWLRGRVFDMILGRETSAGSTFWDSYV